MKNVILSFLIIVVVYVTGGVLIYYFDEVSGGCYDFITSLPTDKKGMDTQTIMFIRLFPTILISSFFIMGMLEDDVDFASYN